MILWDLFLGFLRVGCFAFGGAYGAIPIIRDIVLSYGWLDEEMLVYFIAVSESTPGPIIVNLATYIGSSQAGILGAAVATGAVVLPSFIIILLVMGALKKLLKHSYVQAVFDGLKPCMAGIILATGIYMIIHNTLSSAGTLHIDKRAAVLTLLLTAMIAIDRKLLKRKMAPISFLCISAFLGIVIYSI